MFFQLFYVDADLLVYEKLVKIPVCVDKFLDNECILFCITNDFFHSYVHCTFKR